MRLLTHNYLISNVKGTKDGYPLRIEPSEVTVEESPFDQDLVTRILPKLDYAAVKAALSQVVDKVEPKPAEIPESLPDGEIDSPTLEALYHVLFNIHVIEGNLVCPDTGRQFPIKQGIPNMILHEDEI
eukprot:scaffold2149_cov187-Cylindrotheca_fusiformis.AAC.19